MLHYLALKPFKHQSQKIVKHNQTIRRQQLTNCLSVFDHFVGLVLKGLRSDLIRYSNKFKEFVLLGVFDHFLKSVLKALGNNQKANSSTTKH